jgi:hypothetical protein
MIDMRHDGDVAQVGAQAGGCDSGHAGTPRLDAGTSNVTRRHRCHRPHHIVGPLTALRDQAEWRDQRPTNSAPPSW